MAKVGIILPSFEKPMFVLDAINSVINQTFQDWELLIVENSKNKKVCEVIEKSIEDRRVVLDYRNMDNHRNLDQYPTSVIVNECYRNIFLTDIEYLFYLSDDDTLEPECLEELVKVLDQGHDVSYCAIKHWTQQEAGGFIESHDQQVDKLRGIQEIGSPVDCIFDGGQILFRRNCLHELEQPYYPEKGEHTSHCDGVFMTKLISKFAWHPVASNKPLVNHRRTKLSVWRNNRV